jgi:hypothetical protein
MRIRFLFALMLAVALTAGVRLYEYHAQNIGLEGLPPALLGKSWSGYGTKTNNTALQVAAAPGAGLRTYVTMAYCLNTSAATAQAVTINYGAGPTVLAVLNCVPAAKYQEPTYFDPPLAVPANTALNMTPVGSATTTYLFAQGTTAR